MVKEIELLLMAIAVLKGFLYYYHKLSYFLCKLPKYNWAKQILKKSF